MDTRTRSRAYVFSQMLLIAVFAVAALFDPSPGPAVPDGVRVAGVLLCFAGIVIIVAALFAMGSVMQVSPEPKSHGHLVTRGVYRVMRHPMYTGIFVMVVALAMRRPTLAVIIIGVLLIAVLVMKARFEEELLLERYSDYAAYRARTWGVIPFLR